MPFFGVFKLRPPLLKAYLIFAVLAYLVTSLSMLPGWPDAIRCGSTTRAGETLYLSYVDPAGDATYVSAIQTEYRFVTFNAFGYRVSGNGNPAATISWCQTLSGSIRDQLRRGLNTDRFFTTVRSSTEPTTPSLQTQTLVQGACPDSILCSYAGTTYVFWLNGYSAPDRCIYNSPTAPTEQQFLIFTNGDWETSTGSLKTAGCDAESFTHLYSQGRAFNMVRSVAPDATAATTINQIPNWPDVLSCGSSTAPGAFFFLQSATYTAGGALTSVRYQMFYTPEARSVTFTSTGSFSSRTGNAASSSACVGTTIAVLYSQGRAFNIWNFEGTPSVTPTSSLTASLKAPTPGVTPTQSLTVTRTEPKSATKTPRVSIGVLPYLRRPCPTGWYLDSHDDLCYKLFPTRGDQPLTPGTGDSVRMTFDDTVAYCKSQRGWPAVIRDPNTQLNFILQLARTLAPQGFTWWVGVAADRKQKNTGVLQTTNWMTPAGRQAGFYFNWDDTRQMPSYESCVVMAMKGDEATPGGNDKMITVDCYEVHGVVCSRPRILPAISAVNGATPRRIEVVWRQPKTIYFYGAFIPNGTQVSMQTTDWRSPEPPGVRTDCSTIRTLAGASIPKLLNVSRKMINGTSLCGGEPCQVAHIRFPGDWPWVRGATYSFCFFIPIPFRLPLALQEFANNLIPDAYIDVVQKQTEYLSDICDRRKENLNLFYGDRRLDTNRDTRQPWDFEGRWEGEIPP